MARKLTAADRHLIATPELLRYLPRLFIYPLYPEASLTIFIVCSGLWFFSSSLFGLFFVVMFTTGLLQYTLRVLAETALGHGRPPGFGSHEALEFDSRLGRLLAGLLLFCGLAYAGGQLAPELGLALALLGWLVFPAFTLLLALSDSLRFSLAPARLARVALLSGPLYFMLATGLALAWHYGFGPLLAEGMADFRLESLIYSHPSLSRWLGLLAAGYLSLLLAHLLGFIAYHHHEALGLAVEADTTDIEKQDGIDPETRRRKLLETLDGMLRDKRPDQADDVLRHAARELDHTGQLELLDDLAVHDLWPLVRNQAQRCIEAQLAAKKGELAVITVLRMQHHFSGFRTRTAATWLEVCRAALIHRPFDGFEKLAALASEYYPDAPELVDIALLEASFHADRRNDDERALAVLLPHKDKTQHPRHRQLAALIQALSSQR